MKKSSKKSKKKVVKPNWPIKLVIPKGSAVTGWDTRSVS